MDIDPRLLTPNGGIVVDTKDPEGLYRVRVSIPGFVEKSAWAFPVGTMGGGGPKRGGWVVPPEGSDVVVWFLGGDIERPIYTSGAWGNPDAGTEMSTALDTVPVDERAKVQSFELGPMVLTFDEREGKRLLALENKESGDSITWDFEQHALEFNITTALLLHCTGAIDINALQVSINERIVATSPKGI